MRSRLKEVIKDEYYVYGVTESEFEYTVELIDKIVTLRTKDFELESDKIQKGDPLCADDIIDDLAYYKYVDEQHLWQHALIRLQGLIEAVMTNEFARLSPRIRLIGLSSKINAILAEGYSLSADEKKELLLWGKVRNAIAHAPPEKYRPIVQKEDVVEYRDLVLTLYKRWKEEKKQKK
ncbi:hypothetical protein D0S45_00010 [Marinifilum sp. JC120]|nr:hypothetical protein D0S45_00010 [Marinifilum sp. JC120]